MKRAPLPQQDVLVVCLVKGRQRYIWMYDEDRWPEVLQSIRRTALNKRLNFSTDDAAEMATNVVEMANEK